MSAHSENFPWPSYYGEFNFFEQRMTTHKRVSKLEAHGAGVYTLTRDNGKSIRVFVCECYAFGVAQFRETLDKLGNIDAIIISSAWCGYTTDAKVLCREQSVGLFMVSEFMSALHKLDFWNHLTEVETKYYKKNGLL